MHIMPFIKFILILPAIVVLAGYLNVAYAEDPTPTPTPTTSDNSSQGSNIQDCKDNNISVGDCPSYLQKKLSELQGQGKTLSSQISISDNQIKLTEAKIAATEKQ